MRLTRTLEAGNGQVAKKAVVRVRMSSESTLTHDRLSFDLNFERRSEYIGPPWRDCSKLHTC
jgi:hypothetical protein